jgi:hypothetical protein
MKNYWNVPVPILAGILLVLAARAPAQAQIVGQVKANIGYSFMIGDKTLPPGEYTFRMESDAQAMTVQNQKGDNFAQFEVRQTTANHTPRHSELVFRKFGNTEFLSKIFEGGSRSGSELTETSKEEARMVSAGQHAIEHTEEQR